MKIQAGFNLSSTSLQLEVGNAAIVYSLLLASTNHIKLFVVVLLDTILNVSRP